MRSERARRCGYCRLGPKPGWIRGERCPECKGTGFTFEEVSPEYAQAFHAGKKPDRMSLTASLVGAAAVLGALAVFGMLPWWWVLLPLGLIALLYIAAGLVLIHAAATDVERE